MNFLLQHKNEIIVGIICSLIVGLIFYFLSLQRVNMKYSLTTLPIASVRQQGNIIYNNDHLDNLSITLVTIINDGNKALNGKQMLKKTPFTVYLNQGYKILGVYKREKNTTKSLDYNFDVNGNKIIINFDIFNPSDSLGFTVIHTGVSNDDITLTGKWENYNGLKQIERTRNFIVPYILIVILIIALLYMFFDKYSDNRILKGIKEFKDLLFSPIDEDEFERKE